MQSYLAQDDSCDNVGTMKRLLKTAFDSVLTERQRECMSMYYFDRKTVVEIGAELGLDPSTVSRHLKAGRRNLEKLRALV